MLDEESFIDFRCPHCEAQTAFPEVDVGHVRQCPECNEVLIVPEAGSETGLSLPIPITTPRLVLRRFTQDDWKDLMACLDGSSEENVLRWLESDSHVKLTTPDQPFFLGMERLESRKLFGFVSLRFTDPERLQVALEITLNKDLAEGDLAQEAVEALLGFCFKSIKLHRVTATCGGEDAFRRQFFEAVGMRREAEFVKEKRMDGEWVNTVLYAALEEEYAD